MRHCRRLDQAAERRVTLTYEAMDRCRAVWFLVSGEEKASAVAQAMTPGVPSSRYSRGRYRRATAPDRKS